MKKEEILVKRNYKKKTNRKAQQLNPGRVAQLVRVSFDMPRLWVLSLVRAHTKINR